TNNGSMALAGLSDRASAAGTLLEHSEILVTGSGNVTLIAGSREEQFGSGSNRFSLEFGQIGAIYNAADTTGAPDPAGSVGYEYQMGRYEISRDMIEKANAAAGLGITLEDMSDRGGNGADRPATGISWYEAAQFVNWLNTSQGYSPAYKFADGAFQLWTSSDKGYDSLNPYRNLNAKYVIPSMDEWYKAAFFDPVTGQYFDFATGSNSTPTSVTGGTEPGTAVYGHAQSQGPADITNAGGLSPYGMMAMSGNAFEWIETAYDTNNSAAGEDRFLRGGAFSTARDPVASLKASDSFPYAPTNEGYNSGFRVVSLHQDVNGLVRLDDSSISVKSGVVQVEGGLEALGSTITTTTGAIGVSGASASIRTLDSALTSDSGNIVLTGNGTRDDVSGIELADTAVRTGGTGIVTLTGRGGIAASGVLLKKIGANGTQIQTGDGAITIEGLSDDTAGNGIQVDGASVETTAAGSIVLRGAGSTGNSGILLQGDGSQSSQIATTNGSLTLQGWAGDGGDAVVATKYRVTTTGEGSINVLGSVNGAGTYAFSATDSIIAATGSGNVDIRAESRQYQFGDTSAYGPSNPAALEIDFTTIGAPGNDDDTTGNPNPAGKVDYVYQIGTYEISRGQIEAYNAAWGTANGLTITLADMADYGGNGV
ncbi:MAG: SUMF1/EgtB/PvdO family nonheme iron enzyme, partial [Planctomycetaceae bacterium]